MYISSTNYIYLENSDEQDLNKSFTLFVEIFQVYVS